MEVGLRGPRRTLHHKGTKTRNGRDETVFLRPRTEIGLTTEAKESTESGEVGIPLRTLQILCVLCGSISDLGLR